MLISIPLEMVLFPLLSILIYSVCLKGGPIFDDMEVIPQASRYPFEWKVMRDQARPLSSFLMACWMKWPGTMRGVHSANCWIHAGNAFLVDRMALSLGADPVQAMACGLFFVAMPFAANTVAYMSGHANLLAAFFGLLGCLAILSGWGLLSIPCLIGAYWCKEDGLGFAITFSVVALWRRDFITAGALAVGGCILIYKVRAWLFRIVRQRGDVEMSAIGLPVSYPQPKHGLVVLAATLRRLPFWFLGLKQSPYHGSGLKK